MSIFKFSNSQIFKLTTCLLLISQLSFAQKTDSLTVNDFFFENIETSVKTEREKLLKESVNGQFWKQFSEKFAADFDYKNQYKKLYQEPNADKWEMSLYNARKSQADFYKSHADFAKFSPDFKHFVETHIRYNYWHLLLSHPILRANADQTSMRLYSLPNLMTEALDLSKVSDEKALLVEPYRHFLYYFATYFNSKNRQFEKYKNMSAAMADKSQFAAKNFSGKVQKYYLTRLLLETCNNTPAEAIKLTMAQLSALPQSENYAQVALKNCNEAMNRKEPIKTEPDKSGFELLGLDDNWFNTKKYKGKIVYVDFWASWCGPCRQEMPFSKLMQAKFDEKQKQKIVFLNISIDAQKEKWKQAVEQLQLEGENGWSPEIGGKLKIDTIPRYMVFDKDGKILNPAASRPSDPNTLNYLKKLIE